MSRKPGKIFFMSLDPCKLSSTLFWDVDQKSVNWQQHRVWLLQRVLERGKWEDWLLVSGDLSPSDLRELEPRLKLQPRERRFLLNWITRNDEP
jgi:hypothetical protein